MSRGSLLGPIDNANRILGLIPVLHQHPQHLDPRRHAEDTVVPATRRLRVKVGAGDRRRTRLLARLDRKLIAHFVNGDLAAQRRRGGGEPVPNLPVGV